MYKPNPHFPDAPWCASPAFTAWLDVAGDGFPNADRLPLRALFIHQKKIKAEQARRLAKQGGQ
jgi:hypothetical protein